MFNGTPVNAKKPTLLEKALSISKKIDMKDITDEHIELALAWLEGRISMRQVRVATNDKNAYMKIGLWLKVAYDKGFLTVN